MHEWALAESVLETVKNELENHPGADLIAVRILFGELQDIDEEIFRGGIETLLADYPYSMDVFQIEMEEARFRCKRCEAEWILADCGDLSDDDKESIHFLPEASHVYIRCTSCKSPDFEVIQGRGVSIKAIEIEEKG
jgi:hydrogenase nickel incorporation protein HypA/HybF